MDKKNMNLTLADLDDYSRLHENAFFGVDFAIDYLEIELSKSRYTVEKNPAIYWRLRRDMPYIIHDTQIEGTQILLNRNYKPLGSIIDSSGERLIYEEYPNLHVRLTQEQIKTIVGDREGNYLFGDGNPPWYNRESAKSYLLRLLALRNILIA